MAERAEAGARPSSGQALELGKLNRHWYRRCLDSLGQRLREAGSRPTIREIENLTDQVVTDFLKAVTSQAPGLEAPQFPADRAYFIPFEGDQAQRFNFSKPYYQLIAAPEERELENSLWSFLPGSSKQVKIDSESSVEKDGETKSFRQMISPLEVARARRPGAGEKRRVKKSLMLRHDRADLLRNPGLKRILRHGAFRGRLRTAFAEIFEVYRTLPGDSDVELILVNQLHVLRWLAALSGLVAAAGQEGRFGESGEALTMQQGGFKQCLKPLLRGYFLHPTQEPTGRQDEILRLLETFIEEGEREPGESSGDGKGRSSLEGIVELLYKEREKLQNVSAFFRGLHEPLVAESGGVSEETGGDREPPQDRQITKKAIEDHLAGLIPHFTSFFQYFLRPELEEELDQRFEGRADDPWRAGTPDLSYVWVCADFDDVELSPARSDDRGRADLETVQESLRRINEPYRRFFRSLEAMLLAENRSAISNYWRTLGQAARRSNRVYASHADRDQGVTTPPRDLFPGGGAQDEDPYPQNIFLRVRVRDSLKEPVLDGLFVFSNDYDEHRTWKKSREERREDVEDLLAFSKVFFFIFRDYLHGLDRARESSDLGKLNQYLFSKRLTELESLLAQRLELRGEGRAADDAEAWGETVYSLVNNYAHALLDKPPDVRHETFPYDRLLLWPLEQPGTEAGGSEDFTLPFYLFQAVFVECLDDKIDGSHYSLLKPFQSPLELSDEEGVRPPEAAGWGKNSTESARFRSRTFQKGFETDDGWEKLSVYLEKHYLGTCELDPEGRYLKDSPPKTHVVKASEDDRGATWAKQALLDFWREDKNRSKGPLDAWVVFLSRLTEDLRSLRAPGSRSRRSEADRHWFLFRFGLLSALLRVLDRDDAKLHSLQELYREQELKLKFGDDPNLDILWLAGGPGRAATKRGSDERPPDVVGPLLHGKGPAAERNEWGRGASFSSFFLRQGEPLTLEFLHFLTTRVCQGPSWAASETAPGGGREAEAPTWYQPVLFRPLEWEAQSKDTKDADTKVASAEQAIGDRTPPYRDVEQGLDALGMFLGVVTLRVGRSDREARSFRALVAMIRDFDDSRTGLFGSEREVRERLQSDLEDLTLFTGRFFQTAQGALETARERQQVKLLSEDIQQIARYWYSEGIDRVVHALRDELDRLVRRPDRPALNVLRPELVERLFNSTVEVLQHQPGRGRGRGDRGVVLESFPFDRVFHVPLLFGRDQAAPLCYVRTIPAGAEEVDSELSSLAPRDYGKRAYEEIRKKGRREVLGGTNKRLDGEPIHVRLSEPESRALVDATLPSASEGSMEHGSPRTLFRLLVRLAEPADLDPLIRRFYHATPLQTLTLGGVLDYLAELAGRLAREGDEETVTPEDSAALSRLQRRTRQVLEDTVRSLEPGTDPMSQGLPRAEVAMDARGFLSSLVEDSEGAEGDADKVPDRQPLRHLEKLPDLVADREQLVFLRELFQGLELAHPADRRSDWTYGLEPGVPSKAFYVFYSIPAPEGFLDELPLAPRYRGVFCFVLDDARTDDKSGDQSAEKADQEDIKTFIHNAINSLRLILQQQALEHIRLQPGVEQFVHGMLHRLKNDLNEPAKSFAKIEQAVRRWEQREEEREELLRRIRAGQGTLAGVHDIFHRLKGFTEKGTGSVPLQVFTSDVLGWLFVEQLCDAVEKSLNAGDSGGEGEFRRGLEPLRRRCERERRASERAAFEVGGATGNGERPGSPPKPRGPSAAPVQLVEKHLHNLEEKIEDWLRARFDEAGIEVHLSYDVFSTDPLAFRGSYQLPEALNILTENAFQAAWAYLEKRLDDPGQAEAMSGPPMIQLALICRRSELRDDEIFIEFYNSSPGLDPEFKESLNAPVAQPISAQRYGRSGGKKRGGSGFGHYFARQIVSGYCGGREARRHLDIEIEEVADDLCRVRVNLLEARSARPYLLPVEQLLDEAGRAFRELRRELQQLGSSAGENGDRARGGLTCRLSGDIKPADLMEAARSVLLADRRLKEAELESIVRLRVRRCVTRNVNALCTRLTDLLAERVPEAAGDGATPSETAGTMAAELARGAVRQDSFHDLKAWLEGWRKRDPGGLRDVLGELQACLELEREQASASRQRPLDRKLEIAGRLSEFLDRGELSAADVLTEKELDSIGRAFDPFKPYLRADVVAQGPVVLTEALRPGPGGFPTADRAHLQGLLLEEQWDCESTFKDSTFQMELALYDTEPPEDRERSQQDSSSILEELAREPMASTFAQYRAALSGLEPQEAGGGGQSLELVRWVNSGSAASSSGRRRHQVCGRSVTLKLALETPAGRTGPEGVQQGGEA